jgi:hypothetical protein
MSDSRPRTHLWRHLVSVIRSSLFRVVQGVVVCRYIYCSHCRKHCAGLVVAVRLCCCRTMCSNVRDVVLGVQVIAGSSAVH